MNDYFMLTSTSLCENGERLQMAHLRRSASGSNERSIKIDESFFYFYHF
jgi:hypothetical protein